jgi:hypothetical protein
MRRCLPALAVLSSLAGCGSAASTADGGAPDAGHPKRDLAAAGLDSAASSDLGDTGQPMPSGCIVDVSSGDHQYDCDGIKYDVSIPAACLQSHCGLIVDVHGLTMSGKMEDNNTGLRALGVQYGYLVVQPNANPMPPLSSWNPTTDDDKVYAFTQLAAQVFRADPKRLHFTGFSQGGMMSFRFLCKHSDVFASIAPGAGTACSFSGSDTPPQQIPVLYMHGTQDALISFNLFAVPQRDAVVNGWQMGAGQVIQSDASYTWTRYTNASGNVFEFIQHDYAASSFVLKGHCYPGSPDLNGGEPGQLFGFACEPPNAFNWGQAVMQFFMAHPRP